MVINLSTVVLKLQCTINVCEFELCVCTYKEFSANFWQNLKYYTWAEMESIIGRIRSVLGCICANEGIAL